MGRILRLVAFSVAFVAVQPAFAKPKADHPHGGGNGGDVHAVPELSTTGAAAGLALIAGGAAIVLGRRRARRRQQ